MATPILSILQILLYLLNPYPLLVVRKTIHFVYRETWELLWELYVHAEKPPSFPIENRDALYIVNRDTLYI